MKHFLCVSVLVLLWTGTAPAQAPEAMNAILGNWATQGYGAVVRFESCKDKRERLCGTLVWAWDPSDIEPDALGSLMFEGAEFDGEIWSKGKLKSPEDGRTYRGTISQTSADTIKLKGCAAGIFCKTQVWHRLESLPHVKGLANIEPGGE